MNYLKRWYRHWADPVIVKQSAILSFFVGTFLIGLNMGSKIIQLKIGLYTTIRIAITYVVPFLFSSFTAVRTQLRLKPGQNSIYDATYRCEECLEDGQIHEVDLKKDEEIPDCPEAGSDTEYSLYAKK